VIADLGTALDDPAQRRAALRVGAEAAEREEGSVSVVICEVLQDLSGPLRWAVVEGQCDDWFTNVVAPVDHHSLAPKAGQVVIGAA
jgi:hypothetical protein